MYKGDHDLGKATVACNCRVVGYRMGSLYALLARQCGFVDCDPLECGSILPSNNSNIDPRRDQMEIPAIMFFLPRQDIDRET